MISEGMKKVFLRELDQAAWLLGVSDPKTLIDPKQAGEVLGIKACKVVSAVRKGRLPAQQRGHHGGGGKARTKTLMYLQDVVAYGLSRGETLYDSPENLFGKYKKHD